MKSETCDSTNVNRGMFRETGVVAPGKTGNGRQENGADAWSDKGLDGDALARLKRGRMKSTGCSSVSIQYWSRAWQTSSYSETECPARRAERAPNRARPKSCCLPAYATSNAAQRLIALTTVAPGTPRRTSACRRSLSIGQNQGKSRVNWSVGPQPFPDECCLPSAWPAAGGSRSGQRASPSRRWRCRRPRWQARPAEPT